MFDIRARRSVLLLLISSFYSTFEVPFHFPEQVKGDNGDLIWVVDTGKDASCVHLKDCPTYSWLMDYKNIQNEIIQIEPLQIKNILKGKKCAMDELTTADVTELTLNTRISCPHNVEAYDDYDEYVEGEEVNVGVRDDDYEEECPGERNGGIINGGGLRTKSATDERQCSLAITHGDWRNPLSSLQTKHFSGEINDYQKLRKLRKRRVLHIKAHGNCCWDIFTKFRFKGMSYYVQPGYSGPPTHQPRSIKRVCCSP